MEKITQTVCLVLFIAFATNTQAQIGGLLKKAKDKITDKKEVTKTAPLENTQTGNSNSSGSQATETPKEEKQTEVTLFTFPDARYGNEYQGRTYNLSQIKESYGALASLTHVRKENEKGTFHFAKDYTELKSLINDDHLANTTIQFSGTPFKNGKGDGKTSFSSNGQHIYALLEAKTGTVKEALKINNDENYRLSLMYFLYSDDANSIEGNAQTSSGNFVVTPQMAKEKYLVIDIMPAKENAVIYVYDKEDFNSTASSFAYLHTQDKFSKSGNYKVRICIKGNVTDEWGKPKYNESIEYNGFFDYSFAIKDAKARVAEGSELYTYMKENVNNAPIALPAQWKAATSPLVMGIAQAKLIDMFRNHFDGKLSDFNLVKLHATNSNGGWTIEKNELGIPKYRYSSQWYTIFMKSKNGKACFYQGFGLRQNYEGGGKYSASFIDPDTYHYVNCEEMN
jgi:hypothetical protein